MNAVPLTTPYLHSWEDYLFPRVMKTGDLAGGLRYTVIRYSVLKIGNYKKSV